MSCGFKVVEPIMTDLRGVLKTLEPSKSPEVLCIMQDMEASNIVINVVHTENIERVS